MIKDLLFAYFNIYRIKNKNKKKQPKRVAQIIRYPKVVVYQSTTATAQFMNIKVVFNYQ